MQEKTQFLEQGRMFGAYQVVRELGRGGMGAVYLVRDPSSGAELAAKVASCVGEERAEGVEPVANFQRPPSGVTGADLYASAFDVQDPGLRHS